MFATRQRDKSPPTAGKAVRWVGAACGAVCVSDLRPGWQYDYAMASASLEPQSDLIAAECVANEKGKPGVSRGRMCSPTGRAHPSLPIGRQRRSVPARPE